MTIYRSRISIFLVVSIVVPLLAALVIMCLPGQFDLIGLIVLILVALLIAYLFWQTKYAIHEDMLYVSTGIGRPDVYDLKDLSRIAPSRSLLSAPALSLKRIRLSFSDGREVLISPRQQDAFLAEIRKINPKVHIDETLC